MIGNDVIDLALARKESNWKRKGFLDKIFTKQEQLFILNSNNPEIMVWNLWSRKEAAYKIYNRQSKIREYIPLHLECFDNKLIDGFFYGKVICKGNNYYTKTKITSEFVHTIATINTNYFKNLEIDFFDNKEKSFNKALIIKDKFGIPFLKNEKQELDFITISHHGRFCSYISTR